MEYAIWDACIKVGIIPPDLPGSQWDECTPHQQAKILAFVQAKNWLENRSEANANRKARTNAKTGRKPRKGRAR